ncbi:hypothetical protein RI367_000198 [Sorochytrium milnesiophthora]
MVNIGSSANDFFQTDSQLLAAKVRQLKCSNTLGQPVEVPSKILAAEHFNSAYAAHPRLFLVGDAGRVVRMVNYETGKSVAAYKGHSGPVSVVTYFDDSQADDAFIVTGSWDKTIRVWSYKSGTCVKTISGHSDYVKALLVSPDNKTLYSGSTDATIRCTDLATGTTQRVLKGHRRAVEELLLSADGLELYSCSSDGTIRIWTLATGDCKATLNGHDTSVCSMRMDVDSALWSASADRTVCRWNSSTNSIDTRLTHPDFVKCVLPIEHGGYVVTGCRDERIRVWDVATERVIKEVDGHFDDIIGLMAVGDEVYSASLDGTLRKWAVRDLLDGSVEFKLDVAATLDDGAADSVQQVDSKKLNQLTEEEEAELAELMSDNDDDN